MTKNSIIGLVAITVIALGAIGGYAFYQNQGEDNGNKQEVSNFQECEEKQGTLSGDFNQICTYENKDYTRELTDQEKLTKITTFEKCESEGGVVEENTCEIYGKEFTKEPELLTYTNPDYPDFSFEYPSDWESEESDNGIKLKKYGAELDISFFAFGPTGGVSRFLSEDEITKIDENIVRVNEWYYDESFILYKYKDLQNYFFEGSEEFNSAVARGSQLPGSECLENNTCVALGSTTMFNNIKTSTKKDIYKDLKDGGDNEDFLEKWDSIAGVDISLLISKSSEEDMVNDVDSIIGTIEN